MSVTETSREQPKSAISKVQKQQKDLKVSKYSLLRHPKKTQKLNRIGAPEGTLLDFLSILSKIVKKIGGAPLVKKKICKKVSMPKKLSLNAEKKICRNFENVISEHPNFENVISEHPNFENV